MMSEKTNVAGIKSWEEADRPREKLLHLGRRALSDAELLAILIGSGADGLSAVELSRQVLADLDNCLQELSRCSAEKLCNYKGIGPAKALSILAALELGRRRKFVKPTSKPLLDSSSKVFEHLRPVFTDLRHEECWALFMDSQFRLIKKVMIGKGGMEFTPVDIKQIVRSAFECHALSITLAHNHPSGVLKPSKADIYLTDRLDNVLTMMQLQLNDHLIFSDTDYYSFKDDGMLE